MFFHSHGAAGSIQISLDYPYYLYNYDLNNVSLSDLRCAVLLSCKSGKYVPSTTSMVQTLVNRGAECVVGFNDNITVDYGNLFAERLAYNTMYFWYTVEDAIDNMSISGMTNNMKELSVIGGDGTVDLIDY